MNVAKGIRWPDLVRSTPEVDQLVPNDCVHITSDRFTPFFLIPSLQYQTYYHDIPTKLCIVYMSSLNPHDMTNSVLPVPLVLLNAPPESSRDSVVTSLNSSICCIK